MPMSVFVEIDLTITSHRNGVELFRRRGLHCALASNGFKNMKERQGLCASVPIPCRDRHGG
jgi:hypothetical protein